MRALLLLLLPLPAAAHPHVFVDSAVEVILDGAGSVTGVRLTWTYDEYFSLLLATDLGLDADGDMALTDAEQATLLAYVEDWPADFAGDLVVMQGDAPLALAPRQETAATYAGGVITETHVRPLAAPIRADAPVVVQNFDPYYYVAYAIDADVRITGGQGCEAVLRRADLGAAQAEVDGLLQGLSVADAPADVTLPPVGYAFTDSVEVTCPG